ncbi:hypothetical protein FRB95_012110 [Tulasnella sp. JGI-2019a]|nr:hypothetical protein FRB95_012110 [Tulasnella sp. JGI-2019a]
MGNFDGHGCGIVRSRSPRIGQWRLHNDWDGPWRLSSDDGQQPQRRWRTRSIRNKGASHRDNQAGSWHGSSWADADAKTKGEARQRPMKSNGRDLIIHAGAALDPWIDRKPGGLTKDANERQKSS